MSIQNAIHLLRQVDADTTLREGMYNCINGSELQTFLASSGFPFDSNEFEDAVNHLHTQCQTLEQAQDLLHKADWLRYMLLTD